MDYQKFLEEKRKLSEESSSEEREAVMRRGLELVVASVGEHGVRIHDMMKKTLVSCSEETAEVTLAYEVEEWELNPNGVMHGGLIGTAIDTACGMVTRYMSENLLASTVSLNVDYLRPVSGGDRLLVTAKLVRLGGHVANLRAEARRESDGEPAALATAVFYLPDAGGKT
ncbi:MAG: PaaI family thioesterase [Lachnospiraceae bacterium]|nr:PaaI family thioesterase [Lachnospiraceae bacterium]